MALADLIARLEREADARSFELDAQAGAEAEKLRAEATRSSEERRERELATRREERRTTLDAALAEARRKMRGARLTAQHALLARVFARARELVPEVARSPAYLQAVPQHLAEARRFVEGLEVEVRCPPELAALLPGAVADPAVAPGVVVKAVDGSVHLDNTLPARLQRLEARLAVELLAQLVEERR